MWPGLERIRRRANDQVAQRPDSTHELDRCQADRWPRNPDHLTECPDLDAPETTICTSEGVDKLRVRGYMQRQGLHMGYMNTEKQKDRSV